MRMWRWWMWGVCVALIGWSQPAQAAGVHVGEVAPEFTLQDANEQERSLAEFGGRYIVLEWFNHKCPFVRKHYDSGKMQALQAAYTEQNVAWLTIISSAPGKQGHCTAEQAREVTSQDEAVPTAVLLDPEGTVGRMYGAKTTPHMFVIDPEGSVIYAGAIDSIASTNLDDIPKATNFVQALLDAVLSGQSVEAAETASYGCSVKY